MSTGEYFHTHRAVRDVWDGQPGRVVCHMPDGTVKGYIQRVRLQTPGGHVLARPGFLTFDEHGAPLYGGQYEDTFYRATEMVSER